MKEKLNQVFRDKLVLVMLVLGLLTIVAAAGVFTIQRGNGQQANPYVDMQEQEEFLAKDSEQMTDTGESFAAENDRKDTEVKEIQDTADLRETSGISKGEEELFASAETLEQENSPVKEAGTGLSGTQSLVLDFSDTSKLAWPVRGNVLLDYSMDTTIYFPTLDQYKCNPGLVIQGEVSDPVYAPANARVLEAGTNEEIGNYLTLDLGNGYEAVCGQLKEVAAVPGEYLEKGQLLGYVAEPTKYYSVEGSNVFFELKHEGKMADPLDYLE